MNVKVSVGELIDKFNILEIKYNYIDDLEKKNLIKKEIDCLNYLNCCCNIINKSPLFYKMLTFVNQKIWKITDIIKSINYTDSTYAYNSYQIFEFNQKRFRIKSFFNILNDSELKEQKSYSTFSCRIHINNILTFYNKLPEINYLSIEYDTLVFDNKYEEYIKLIFKQSNFIFDSNNHLINDTCIDLSNFIIDGSERNNFDFSHISYISGGLLGDFIHNLSIPYEIFKKTGMKANIYLANGFGGDNFSFGLENTFNDIYDIISKQFYINKFKIYEGEQFNINLNDWRKSDKLYKESFYEIYKSTYNINWGTEKWIYIDTNNKIKNYWSDKIVVNTTYYRFTDNINYNELYEKYSEKIIFISNNENDYKFFINKTGLNIPYYKLSSFNELCDIINSCYLFIGSLSSPLAIAHSIDKKRIVGFANNCIDNIMIYKLQDKWQNMFIDRLNIDI